LAGTALLRYINREAEKLHEFGAEPWRSYIKEYIKKKEKFFHSSASRRTVCILAGLLDTPFSTGLASACQVPPPVRVALGGKGIIVEARLNEEAGRRVEVWSGNGPRLRQAQG